MTETIAREIKAFVVTNFLFGQEGAGLPEDQSFLESGVIDSTGVLELVAFLEERYGIAVADRELLPENLDSIQNVSRFVARKLDTPSVDRQGAQVAG
ncbi:MAG: acyl carrier protein [Vicinamibacterales bacterium]